jgi:phosphatidylinositol glycan class S
VQKVATVLTPNETGFATWEIDSLVHARLVSDSRAAISTLQSLDAIISSISGIPIPDVIVDSISTAFEELEAATRFASATMYNEALSSANKAYAAAEEAFFHPFSLGGLTVYPFEYKLAALIPVLLSTVLPLTLMFIRELNHEFVRKSCAAEARRGKAKSA